MNYVKFTFILPDNWADFKKNAQFIQDGQAYNRELDENNSVFLPAEIHAGSFELVLRGGFGLVSAVTDGLILTAKKSNYQAGGKDDEYIFATVDEMKRYLNIE